MTTNVVDSTKTQTTSEETTSNMATISPSFATTHSPDVDPNNLASSTDTQLLTIALGAIGGGFLLALIAVAAYCFLCKSKKSPQGGTTGGLEMQSNHLSDQYGALPPRQDLPSFESGG